jgi:hypothetical protein
VNQHVLHGLRLAEPFVVFNSNFHGGPIEPQTDLRNVSDRRRQHCRLRFRCWIHGLSHNLQRSKSTQIPVADLNGDPLQPNSGPRAYIPNNLRIQRYEDPYATDANRNPQCPPMWSHVLTARVASSKGTQFPRVNIEQHFASSRDGVIHPAIVRLWEVIRQ